MGMLWKVITSSEVKDVLLHSCKAPAMGVSSFGFGGTNTHACGDQSWRPKWQDWDIAPYKLIGWSVCWLIGWLVDWLIGWLIVWLVNCLMEGYSPSKNWYQDRTASRFFFVFSGSFPVSWGCWCPHANQRRCLPSVLSASDPSGFCQSCVTSYDPTWQYEQPPCSIGQNHMKNNEQPPFSIGQNMPKPSIYFFFPGHVW